MKKEKKNTTALADYKKKRIPTPKSPALPVPTKTIKLSTTELYCAMLNSHHRHGQNSPVANIYLISLAYRISLSVIKKVTEYTDNSLLKRVGISLFKQWRADLDYLCYGVDNRIDVDTLYMDIVHDIIAYILEHDNGLMYDYKTWLKVRHNGKKANGKKNSLIINDFTTPKAEKVLNARVRVQFDDSPIYKTDYTSCVQRLWRVARQSINHNGGGLLIGSHKYMYIEDLEHNGLYHRRASHWYNVGGGIDANNINHGRNDFLNTMHFNEMKNTDDIIKSLNLSAQQTKVLNYRLQGYGYKTIAHHLNVTHNTIIKHMERVKAKAEKIYPQLAEKMKKATTTTTP